MTTEDRIRQHTQLRVALRLSKVGYIQIKGMRRILTGLPIKLAV